MAADGSPIHGRPRHYSSPKTALFIADHNTIHGILEVVSDLEMFAVCRIVPWSAMNSGVVGLEIFAVCIRMPINM